MKPVIPGPRAVEQPVLFRRCSPARPPIASIVPVSSPAVGTTIWSRTSIPMVFSTIPRCYYLY
jgi:hypothetical protein